MPSDDAARMHLLAQAEELLIARVEFAAVSAGMLELEVRSHPPARLSCSQFVRYVLERAFPKCDWQAVLICDALRAASHGAAFDLFCGLPPAEPVRTGDLSFFTRSDVDGSDEWHVMMRARDPAYLVGSCPLLRGVGTCRFAEYLRMADADGRSWVHRGDRRFPIYPFVHFGSGTGSA